MDDPTLADFPVDDVHHGKYGAESIIVQDEAFTDNTIIADPISADQKLKRSPPAEATCPSQEKMNYLFEHPFDKPHWAKRRRSLS